MVVGVGVGGVDGSVVLTAVPGEVVAGDLVVVGVGVVAVLGTGCAAPPTVVADAGSKTVVASDPGTVVDESTSDPPGSVVCPTASGAVAPGAEVEVRPEIAG